MTLEYTLSARQARLLRLKAQQLAHPTGGSPAVVLHQVCGVQAQDLPSALLAIRARSRGLTTAQVEAARNAAPARNQAPAPNTAPAQDTAPSRNPASTRNISPKRSVVATRNGAPVQNSGEASGEAPGLAWIWCMRGTLHLVTAEDARWLVPLLGPSLIAGNERRMVQLGWDEESAARGIQLVRGAVEQNGPLTRAEIACLLKENHLPHEGQAPVHLLYRAVLEGVICSGPDRGKEHTYTQFAGWLGELQPLPRMDGYAQIARRFLQAYAPAGPEDLAIWSGLKRSEAREAWKLIADELTAVRIVENSPSGAKADRPDATRRAQPAGQTAWMLASQIPWLDEPAPAQPVVNLLPRYDTLWMGYANRDWLVDPAFTKRINLGGGVIHPILLVDGRALGTWKTARKRKALVVQLEPFEPLSAEILAGVEAEVADMASFLEEEVTLDRANLG